MPRQRCQTLNSEVHIDNLRIQKQNILNSKLKSYEDIKNKTEFLLESNLEAQSLMKNLLMKKTDLIRKYLENSNRKLMIRNIKNGNPECCVDLYCAPINLFKDLNTN